MMEAPTRFERVMEVLQTSALPLGDGAEIYNRYRLRPGINIKNVRLLSRGKENKFIQQRRLSRGDERPVNPASA